MKFRSRILALSISFLATALISSGVPQMAEAKVLLKSQPNSPAPIVLPVTTFGGHFSNPESIVSDGTHLWVANFNDNSVTELNLSDGSLVRVLNDPSYAFDGPYSLASDGTHLWVANYRFISVTELNLSDGSLVRVVSGFRGNAHPIAFAADGTHLWVANYGGGGDGSYAVTELNLADGSLVRNLSDPSYGFNQPSALALDGTHLWVVNYGKNHESVTEINIADGSLVRNISGPSYGFDFPEGVVSDGTHLWVANYGNNSVTELNLADGSLVRNLSGPSYGFNGPGDLVSDGTHLWVAGGGSITELNLATGDLVAVFGASYPFSQIRGLTLDGSRLWIANAGNNTVTVMGLGNPPSTPTNIAIKPGNTSALISWSAPGNVGLPLTTFKATVQPGNKSCTTVARSCVISRLTNGQRYMATVSAQSAFGNAAPTSPVAVTPGTTPGAVTGVRISQSGTTLNVNFRLLTGASTGGLPINKYFISVEGGGQFLECQTTSSSCAIGPVASRVTYITTVVALNDIGSGPSSAELRFVTR